MKTGLHAGLLTRVIAAIILGIGAAFIFPEWLSRIFATFGAVFSSFLGFVIPLLIVGFVAPAIADIGRKAGIMLVWTVAVAYAMTFGSGLLAYFTSSSIFPSLIETGSYTTALSADAAGPAPYFSIEIEPIMTVMASLVLAFVLGFACAMAPDRTATLKKVLVDFRSVIQILITGVVIPLLPVYIFNIFLNMTAAGAVGAILMTFIKIIAIIFALHIGLLVLQYLIAALFSGYNPFKSLRTMLPAYATALGTQSSAATIPVTLEQTIKMGVSKDVAGFVIPLCATIHMSGSTLKIVSCALALMIVKGIPYDIGMFSAFIALLGITIVAAPGVPGGAIMASLGLLSSILGFSDADNAMMIALYISMDSFGTACNITGDGAIAQIIDRICRRSRAVTSVEGATQA